jgi:hypothetical protein
MRNLKKNHMKVKEDLLGERMGAERESNRGRE